MALIGMTSTAATAVRPATRRRSRAKARPPRAYAVICAELRGLGGLVLEREVTVQLTYDRHAPDGGAHGVSAALEYAVRALRVRHIVVLGHAQCGGIRAFIDNNAPLSPGDFIGRWMSMFVKPGEKVEQRDHETMADFTVRIEKAAVFRSLENLTTFPFVQAAVARGELNLHGAYFGVAEGSLFVLDPAAKEFRSVREMLQAGG